MSTFDKREDSFEKQFAHNEELRFKATARRDKLLGLWAAEKLGKIGPAAEDYARQLVASDVQKGSEKDVFALIRRDFDAAGVAQSDHQIHRTMEELGAKAIAQIKANG